MMVGRTRNAKSARAPDEADRRVEPAAGLGVPTGPSAWIEAPEDELGRPRR